MERCIFNVYKYSIVLESQSIKPYAESDKVGSLAAQMFKKSAHSYKCSCHTSYFGFFVIWNYFRGGNAVNKSMHSAFRIRTDIYLYVGLGLINCVLISLAFSSAVGLDGEIF